MAATEAPAAAVESTEPVTYMMIETGDGHLFVFDKHAAEKYSVTLRDMIQAHTALGSAADAEASKAVSIKLEHNTRAIDGVIDFLYYIKKWKVGMPNWAPPKDSPQEVVQEMLVAAHFLDC